MIKSNPRLYKRSLLFLMALVLQHSAWGFPAMSSMTCHRPPSQLSMSDMDEDYYASLLLEKEEDQIILPPMDAIKAYRDKQRSKREWGHELENWKQLGIQARRNRRGVTRQEQFSVKAARLAKNYVLMQSEPEEAATADTLPKVQKATAFFQRLLEHVYEMEQQAYQRGKERAIQREAEIVNGTATDNMEQYLEELEMVRQEEQENRRVLQEQVFQLPDKWELFEDEILLTILTIRGNVRKVQKAQKRETIERYVRESYAKSLF